MNVFRKILHFLEESDVAKYKIFLIPYKFYFFYNAALPFDNMIKTLFLEQKLSNSLSNFHLTKNEKYLHDHIINFEKYHDISQIWEFSNMRGKNTDKHADLYI